MKTKTNAERSPKIILGGVIFDNHVVVIKKDSFEHLLNCLANQKRQLSKEEQKAVDSCWRQGMDLLNPKKF